MSNDIEKFLKNLAVTSDLYSNTAMEDRRKVLQMDREYRKLGRSVYRSLTTVVRPKREGAHPPKRRMTTVHTGKRVPERAKTPDFWVRPCPYPVGNYALHVPKLVGPSKYFGTKVRQMIKEEEKELEEEYEKYPTAFDHPPQQANKDLVVIGSHSLKLLK